MKPWAGYTPAKFRQDLIAALTVAAISLPQAMAYALLAGVDPRFGLYSAIVVTMLASVFGSSSHLINGPTAAISLATFSALAVYDSGHRADAAEAMFLIAIMVGIIQIMVSVFRLGDLTRYISEAVILGFMTAASIQLAVGQMNNALGVRQMGTGTQHIFYRLWLSLTQGTPVNSRAVTVTLTTVVLAVLSRQLVRRFRLPQLDMLAVLVVVGLVAWSLGWTTPTPAGSTVIGTIGEIPRSLPLPHLPSFGFGEITEFAPSSLAIAALGLLEALAIAKSIAARSHQRLDFNRQCLAEGIANLTGGFFQCVPGAGSLSRSAINYQSGAVTRFSGFLTGLVVAIALLLLAPLSRYVPKSALAGLLLLTATRLIDVHRLAFTFRASRPDAWVILVTAATGLALGLDQAILVGVALSIVLFVPRAARLHATELVVSPEGGVRERLPLDPVGNELIIYDLEGELFFGAAPELERIFAHLETLAAEREVKHIVLRLRRVRNPDVVSLEHFEHFLKHMQTKGISVWLASVRPDMMEAFRRLHFPAWLPEYRVFPQRNDKDSSTVAAIRAIREALPNATPGTSKEIFYQV